MTAMPVRDAILRELSQHGVTLSEAEVHRDLIGAGVNSATLIQILSALEDTFDIDLVTEELFDEPLTVMSLEVELARLVTS